MSFEEWTEVSRKLEEGVVIHFVHSKDSQISKLVRVWLPASWKVIEETNDDLDSQVFLILGGYDFEPRYEERFQRRFVELWLYDRFSHRLTCRSQVITTYPDAEGGLKEVPSPYIWKDRDEIDLSRNVNAAPERFLLMLNQDIFRSNAERKIKAAR
jgi:hypothetical protein